LHDFDGRGLRVKTQRSPHEDTVKEAGSSKESDTINTSRKRLESYGVPVGRSDAKEQQSLGIRPPVLTAGAVGARGQRFEKRAKV